MAKYDAIANRISVLVSLAMCIMAMINDRHDIYIYDHIFDPVTRIDDAEKDALRKSSGRKWEITRLVKPNWETHVEPK